MFGEGSSNKRKKVWVILPLPLQVAAVQIQHLTEPSEKNVMKKYCKNIHFYILNIIM